MSTAKKKLSIKEIQIAFGSESFHAFPQVLTTNEAAAMLGYKPKTLNAWKNAGLLEGTYRKRRNQDRYLRDRLLERYFNGPEWEKNAASTESSIP